MRTEKARGRKCRWLAAARVFLAVLLGSAATPATAQPFELAVVGDSVDCSSPILPLILRRLQFIPHGDAVPSRVPHLAAIAPAGDGRVYGLVENGSAVIDVAPTMRYASVFAGIPGTRGVSLVVDRARNLYIFLLRGNERRVVAVNSDGTVRAEWPLPLLLDGAMDLAADQCTLFYAAYGEVRRFDVCSGTPLPPFGALPELFSALAILRDGGVAGVTFAGTLVHLDSSGVLVASHSLEPYTYYTVIEATEDGTSVYTGGSDQCSAVVERRHLATGARLSAIGGEDLFVTSKVLSVVPYRGWTAAIGATDHQPAPAAVPAISHLALAALASLLALLAIRRAV